MSNLTRKTFIHDVHNKKCSNDWDINWDACDCSYCIGKTKLHYGLNIPKNWRAWNSWWVIKYGPSRYLKWRNTFLKLFK